VLRVVVCPEGAVTVTTNWSAPNCVPSVIVLTTTSCVAGRYVYVTALVTKTPPMYTLTAPVLPTSEAFDVLASIPCSEIVTDETSVDAEP
jgi:hypothetical protein